MGGQGSGRRRSTIPVELCWECVHVHMHSDGAVFCSPYAARRVETDPPLQFCDMAIRRVSGPIPKAQGGK